MGLGLGMKIMALMRNFNFTWSILRGDEVSKKSSSSFVMQFQALETNPRGSPARILDWSADRRREAPLVPDLTVINTPKTMSN